MPSLRPNILLILADQHRSDWTRDKPTLPLRMPNLEALANRGVSFSQAITPSPLCGPARACLASGRSYDRCGVFKNEDDYPPNQPTYYAALGDAGYEVAGVGKFDLHKGTRFWNLDGSRELKNWGFTRGIDSEGKWDAIGSGAEKPQGPYMAYLHRRGLAAIHVADMLSRRNGNYTATHPTPLPEDAYSDNWIAENGLAMLADLPRKKPWHLVVNFAGPHEPMDVTESMHRAWRNVNFPLPHVPQSDLAPEQHQQIRRNYAAMIENIDRQVGRLIAAVAQRGELDNTLVVYSSDHGEMLGDHGLWAKSHWRQAALGIPLIVAGPEVMSGKHSEALVSLHDLAATFIEYAGAKSLPSASDSRSIKSLLEGRCSKHRSCLISGLGNWRSISDGRYKLIASSDAAPKLFDLFQDAQEDYEIAAEQPKIIERLQQELLTHGVDPRFVHNQPHS